MKKYLLVAAFVAFLLPNLALSQTTVYPTLSTSLIAYNMTVNQGQIERIQFSIKGGGPVPPFNYSIRVTNASNNAYIAGANAITSANPWSFNFTVPSTPNAYGKLLVNASVTDGYTRLGRASASIFVIGNKTASTTTTTTAAATTASTSVAGFSSASTSSLPTTPTSTVTQIATIQSAIQYGSGNGSQLPYPAIAVAALVGIVAIALYLLNKSRAK